MNLDLSVDIGYYYYATKEIFRVVLFNVKKKSDKANWILPVNVGLWPNFMRALFLSSPQLNKPLY
jgi:hypothetical protein